MSLTMSRRVVSFRVFGEAQPKGSTRAFVPKSWAAQAVAAGRAPRAIVTSDNPRGKGWEAAVRHQAQTVAGDGLFIGPVALSVVFHLPRPKSLAKRILHHTKKPDVSKLARALEDALTGVLYTDDAQIVRLHVEKVYAAIGSAPCAVVTLEEAAAPEPVQTPLTEDSLFSEEALYGEAR